MGEMKKTSPEYCKKCIYSYSTTSIGTTVCNYLNDTDKLRNCPVGWCDKFEGRKGNKRVRRFPLCY